MDYKQLLLSPQGRLNRKPYWIGVLILFVVQLVAQVLSATLEADDLPLIAAVVSLLVIYPSIVLGIKRFHDRDRSGWWLLLVLIPIVGPLWLLVELGFLPGAPGPNRFGPDPLAQETVDHSSA